MADEQMEQARRAAVAADPHPPIRWPEPRTAYSDQAAAFIDATERYAALGLPSLPEDPAAAAAMRAAGYEVLAEVLEVDGPVVIVHVLAEDEDVFHAVSEPELAAALGVCAVELEGLEFIAALRETPETGPVLSGFRPVPGRYPRRMASFTGDQITELSRDMLAQFRGCFPENECYGDCCDAAASAIEGEYLDMMNDREKQERDTELADALAWAKTQRWVGLCPAGSAT